MYRLSDWLICFEKISWYGDDNWLIKNRCTGSIIALQSWQLSLIPKKSSLKINQSFHDLINKFEKFPDYGNLFPVMLNTNLSIFQIVLQNLPDLKMQIVLAALSLVNLSLKVTTFLVRRC